MVNRHYWANIYICQEGTYPSGVRRVKGFKYTSLYKQAYWTHRLRGRLVRYLWLLNMRANASGHTRKDGQNPDRARANTDGGNTSKAQGVYWVKPGSAQLRNGKKVINGQTSAERRVPWFPVAHQSFVLYASK